MDLPKDILKIAGEYTEEPLVLPYLYSENQLDILPPEIQGIVGSYLPVLDYKDLALVTKTASKSINPSLEELIRMPWGHEKEGNLIFGNKSFYPILREAYFRKLLKPEYFHYLFWQALIDHDDYQTVIDLSKEIDSTEIAGGLHNILFQVASGQVQKNLDRAYRQAALLVDLYPNDANGEAHLNEVLELLTQLKWLDLKKILFIRIIRLTLNSSETS